METIGDILTGLLVVILLSLGLVVLIAGNPTYKKELDKANRGRE